MATDAQIPASIITKKQSLGIAFSAIIGAFAVFIVTVITSYVLSPQDNARFLVFWSLMFGVFGSLLGIQQEITRASGNKILSSPGESKNGALVIPIAGFWGLLIAILLLFSSSFWGERILGTDYQFIVLVISLGVVLYSCHVAVVGSAAGKGQWTTFAWLGVWESLMRLGLVILVALTVQTLWGFQYAVLAPVTLWLLLFLVSKQGRSLASTRADVGFSQLNRTIGSSILTSVAYSIMVTGFPVILKVSVGSTITIEETVQLAALILGISITRAPIMIPLQMFQGVAVSAFLRQQHRPVAALLKPIVSLLSLGIVGFLLAYLTGPSLFTLLYSNYSGVLSAFTLGSLTLAAAFMAITVLTGTAALAANRHSLYLMGWVVTVLTAVGCLCLPLDIVTRSTVALIIGPLVGACIHICGLTLHVKDSL